MRPLESPEIEVESIEDIEEVKLWELVIFNDDVNTFDYVIQTLMEVCGHTSHQAEQCTLLIHYKGKCGVKSGEFEELAPVRNEICRRGLSAEIELK